MRVTNLIHFQNLRGDLFGGVTTAIVSLPLALAFGVASGLGPVAGLYGAVCVGFFAALFGGTPTLISEPTGPMTVVMTAVVSTMVLKNPEQGIAMAFTVVMLAGVFQILFGCFRLGKYITLMPYSVISGFMSGIGVILVVLQLAPFLGQPNPGEGVLGTLKALPQMLSMANPAEVALGVLTLAIVFLTPKVVRRYVPPQLIALIVGTIVSLTLLDGIDIRRIGVIPVGWPTLQVPLFAPEQTSTILVNAVVLGMLGCIDTLLTAVIADSLTRTEHDSNKELIGQGLGNLISGICGGLPGAGATMGTVVNIQTGAQTAVSGLTRSVILLVVVLGAAKLTEPIPMAVLAGIALKVGIDILDWSFLQRAHKVSWKGASIMYGVLFLTVFVDLIIAVGVGVFIANILTINRLSELQAHDVRIISDADDDVSLSLEEKQVLDQCQGHVLLFYLSGPMIFGVSRAITRCHAAISDCQVVIIDLSDVPLLGVTATLALENAIIDTIEQGRQVFIVSTDDKIKQRLNVFDIFKRISLENLVTTRIEALQRSLALVGSLGAEEHLSKL